MDKISGKKSTTTIDRGIDWMYQHQHHGAGGAQSELAKEDEAKKQEEFLLGKDFVPDGTTLGDFDNGDQTEGIHNVLASHQEQEAPPTATAEQQQQQQASYYEPSVKDRNESNNMTKNNNMNKLEHYMNVS
eukprot:scaffold22692_cov198-Cylindrotheca_fusiformis.AAC.4